MARRIKHGEVRWYTFHPKIGTLMTQIGMICADFGLLSAIISGISVICVLFIRLPNSTLMPLI